MSDEFLERTRIPDTDFYQDQHGQMWKKISGIYVKTDEEPKPRTPFKNDVSNSIVCKKCKGKVAANIAKCPHCGVDNPADSLMVKIITFVFVVLVGWGVVSFFGSSSEPKQLEQPTESYAYVHCKYNVEQRLKSPSTADFGSINQTAISQLRKGMRGKKHEIQYLVTGYVDSQNSFGAMLRSTYRCKITGQTGGKWYVNDISIQ